MSVQEKIERFAMAAKELYYTLSLTNCPHCRITAMGRCRVSYSISDEIILLLLTQTPMIDRLGQVLGRLLLVIVGEIITGLEREVPKTAVVWPCHEEDQDVAQRHFGDGY